MRFKNCPRIIAGVLIFALSCSLLTGCALTSDGEKYMTREQVEELLDKSMVGNVTVEGGDHYDVTIEGKDSPNVLAAAKGVLSTVSICSHFEYDTGYGPSYSSSKTEDRKGAGVIYRLDKEQGDAYIVTNYHLVYEQSLNTEGHISDAIYAELYGLEGCGMEIACEYVGGSMLYDLAVLRIRGNRILAESNAVAATVADSDEVSVLDTAIAIGNSEGDGLSAAVRYVSLDSEYIELLGVDGRTTVILRVMRLDSALDVGNSGGGLFNDRGELIGIVNAMSADGDRGYATPSTLASRVADNIIYHCDGTEVDCVRRAVVSISLGVERYYTVYDTETGRVHKKEVVRITGVTVGGVAETRLLSGDIIRAVVIDGVSYEIDRMHDVSECMINARVGSTVSFEITRSGIDMSIVLPITEGTLTDW